MEKSKKTWWNRLFYEEEFEQNKAAIKRYNLQFFKLFNVIAIAFMILLFISTFFDDYALELREIYLFFVCLLTAELIVLRIHPPKGDKWIMPLCYIGMAQIYLFCILSGVVYNVDGVAINYHVFLILLPLAVILNFKSLMAVQTLSLVAFVASVLVFKAPDYAIGDIFSAITYYIVGLIITKRLNVMRVDYLGLYQKYDQSEKENAELLNTTPVGIMKLVFSGSAVDVLYANAPSIEMFGYTKEEFDARSEWDFAEVVHPKDYHKIVESLTNPVIGKGYTYDFRLKHKATDTYHWVACKFLITEITDGKITTLTDFLDIDAQKMAEDASRAKSAFLSRMSHEIRTPINAIMGMSELGRQDISSGEMNKEILLNYFNETTAASKYLLTLVNDVLDTSRIENGMIILQPMVVNAQEFLTNVATMIRPLAANKGVELIAERKTKSRESFIGDPVRVQQILVNLLNNAIKFTPSGGKIVFTAEAVNITRETTTLQFTVADNGIGMTEEFQKNLFAPFTQENTDTTSPFEGTGLGLSIAKALAKQMGGDITCKSEKGVGTTFVATFNVENVLDGTEEKKEQTIGDVLNRDLSGVRILLCEDHPLNQKIAKSLLERRKCIVDVADNGEEGLKLFEKSKAGYYSLILMDIRMPVKDGLQTAKEIRGLDREDALTIPIVAMSANAYEEDVQKSIEAGMNAHLAKPVEPEKLYLTIAHYLQSDNNLAEPKKTILIVDDIEVNSAVIEEALCDKYNILTAQDGMEALEILSKNEEIVLVITDIQMPKMDGIGLIKAMRGKYCYDHIAIIANTQYGDPDQEEKLLAIGADDFVYKPTAPAVVATRVRYVLARYRHFYMYRDNNR